jgi:phosphoribosylformylglycinamidine (FGAM) synthase PurS component
MKYEVEIWYKPGVTDAVGDSVKKGIGDLNISGVESVKTGQVYVISGKVGKKEIEKICSGLLANTIVQYYRIKKINK